MENLTAAEFASRRGEFDSAVAATPEIERFCSSSAWLFPARQWLKDPELPEPDETLIRHADGHWLAFSLSPHGYWQPFESAWMFACPLIGASPAGTIDLFRQTAMERTEGFVIGGLPEGGDLQSLLRRTPSKRQREYPATDGLAIDLSHGAEAWLGRRTRKFRRTIQSAEKRCHAAGLTIENLDGSRAPGLFERLQAIQVRTGKWASGTDIFRDDRYFGFYRDLFHDLQRRGALRLLIATRHGADVAFIFGGAFHDEYRGLQMSYAAEVAELGAGNWLQWENLRLRAAEGTRCYDLGMEAPYKLRWADERRVLRFCFIVL